MKRLISAISGLALLAGCNSTDALIPQVDVGEGNFRSPPVNQADLDTMSSQPAYVPQETASIQSGPLDAQPSYTEPSSETMLAQGDMGYTDPAGSLEAQASRLSQGEIPAQERRRVMREAPQLAETPASVEENDPAQVEQAAPQQLAQQQPAEQEKPAQAAALPSTGEAGTIRFLPIIGAPVAAVTSLSKQLGADARANGLTIKSSSDESSRHILKGYFSALNDGGKTTVVYIWDVLDGNGNRLHRIQGQDSVDATAQDPWSVVPPDTMQSIATKSIGAYLSWARGNAG
ncbi:lipoprotein [Pararhizobium arenae]|uniref:lipoprotein n=1 Tax=Pararhizobium arenae TaxID=1856850 RepID=UPI00094B6685|nr:lipoprotein [Pararhizobium arenae]